MLKLDRHMSRSCRLVKPALDLRPLWSHRRGRNRTAMFLIMWPFHHHLQSMLRGRSIFRKTRMGLICLATWEASPCIVVMAAALTVEALILVNDLFTTGSLYFLFIFVYIWSWYYWSCEELVISHWVLVSMEMGGKKRKGTTLLHFTNYL